MHAAVNISSSSALRVFRPPSPKRPQLRRRLVTRAWGGGGGDQRGSSSSVGGDWLDTFEQIVEEIEREIEELEQQAKNPDQGDYVQFERVSTVQSGSQSYVAYESITVIPSRGSDFLIAHPGVRNGGAWLGFLLSFLVPAAYAAGAWRLASRYSRTVYQDNIQSRALLTMLWPAFWMASPKFRNEFNRLWKKQDDRSS